MKAHLRLCEFMKVHFLIFLLPVSRATDKTFLVAEIGHLIYFLVIFNAAIIYLCSSNVCYSDRFVLLVNDSY